MQDPRQLLSDEFKYDLPAEKIALYPAGQREESKLLICRGNEEIYTDGFANIADYLPESCLLVLNNTRVLQARIEFFKTEGARIEIFCLHPVFPVHDIQLAFQLTSGVIWNCMIGNARRWKEGPLIRKIMVDDQNIELTVTRTESERNIEFSWEPKQLSFGEIINYFGEIPLPPYIERESDSNDMERYQTVFADPLGSVAAPTAGLHFTSGVFDKLKTKFIDHEFLTLHVGAGTFKPLNSKYIGEHEMHAEEVFISKHLIGALVEKCDSGIFAVGTTSMRTLETLYWLGLKAKNRELSCDPFVFNQWEAYGEILHNTISRKESLMALLEFLEENNMNGLRGYTRLMIAPGYKIRVVDGLITNFHQPGSTLLLLVSAFIGNRWKEAYNFALENNFRFLSYGDACLFQP